MSVSKYLLSGVLLFTLLVPGRAQQGKASFSCTIDGKTFVGTGTDDMGNAAFKTAPDILTVTLLSMDRKPGSGVPPQMKLTFSPGGATTVKGSAGKYSLQYSPGGIDNDAETVSATITVTSLTATRVSGTFSGSFQHKGKPFKITDGTFDVGASRYTKSLQ